MQDNDLTVIAEYATSMEAETAKSALTNAGIHAEIYNGHTSDIYLGVIPAQLLVRRNDVARAEKVLRLNNNH